MIPEKRAMEAARILMDSTRTQHVALKMTGIAFDVKGDSQGLYDEPYRVMRYRNGEELVESCTCPAMRTCKHIEIARLVMAISHGW